MNEFPRLESNHRLLAVQPHKNGFGYAVMESAGCLVDWGLKEVLENKNPVCLKKIAQLLKEYQPSSLVIEDCIAKGSRRSCRIRQLDQEIRSLASRLAIDCTALPARVVRETFAERKAFDKRQVAEVIANQYPGLRPRIPPERKSWMPEDSRLYIFDAIALCITYLYKNTRVGFSPDGSRNRPSRTPGNIAN